MIMILLVYLSIIEQLFYVIFILYIFLIKIKPNKKLNFTFIDKQHFSIKAKKCHLMCKLYKKVCRNVVSMNLSELFRIKIKKTYKYIFLIFILTFCFIKNLFFA